MVSFTAAKTNLIFSVSESKEQYFIEHLKNYIIKVQEKRLLKYEARP